jgi:hypothetical protein
LKAEFALIARDAASVAMKDPTSILAALKE